MMCRTLKIKRGKRGSEKKRSKMEGQPGEEVKEEEERRDLKNFHFSQIYRIAVNIPFLMII